MENKVVLISINDMRHYVLNTCGNSYVKELEKLCYYTHNARSMEPSATFPCHYLTTHSVTPQRHDVLTNTYIPQVRTVNGVFVKLNEVGGVCAMFFKESE